MNQPKVHVMSVVVNQTKRKQRLSLSLPRGSIQTSLPGKTVATYLWPAPPEQAPQEQAS